MKQNNKGLEKLVLVSYFLCFLCMFLYGINIKLKRELTICLVSMEPKTAITVLHLNVWQIYCVDKIMLYCVWKFSVLKVLHQVRV